MRGDKHQVYRLEVPQEVYWAYQTEGAMNDLLLKIYEEVNNMELAIHIMIENQSKFEDLRDSIKARKTSNDEAISIIKRLTKNYQYENEIN